MLYKYNHSFSNVVLLNLYKEYLNVLLKQER